MAESLAQGRTLALVSRLTKHAHAVPLELAQDFSRAVRAAVVHQDDFFGHRHRLNSADQLADPLLFVVDRDDDRKLEVWGDGINGELSAGRGTEEFLQKRNPVRLGDTAQLIDKMANAAAVGFVGHAHPGSPAESIRSLCQPHPRTPAARLSRINPARVKLN